HGTQQSGRRFQPVSDGFGWYRAVSGGRTGSGGTVEEDSPDAGEMQARAEPRGLEGPDDEPLEPRLQQAGSIKAGSGVCGGQLGAYD
ncbi:MAG: hypothetical protein SGPRY_003829, partial [Prymnesium sp.]